MADTFRQTHRVLNDREKALISDIKVVAEDLRDYLLAVNPSREMTLALTRLEECVMWAVKGITA